MQKVPQKFQIGRKVLISAENSSKDPNYESDKKVVKWVESNFIGASTHKR